jgi:hypothetical protein
VSGRTTIRRSKKADQLKDALDHVWQLVAGIEKVIRHTDASPFPRGGDLKKTGNLGTKIESEAKPAH